MAATAPEAPAEQPPVPLPPVAPAQAVPVPADVEDGSAVPDAAPDAPAPATGEGVLGVPVVWARVKGYPSWPVEFSHLAQVLTPAASERLLKNVRAGKGQNHLPVMWFGTFEVGFVAPALVEPWQTGIDKGYTAKKDKRLLASIQQAQDFLEGVVQPQWWWQPGRGDAPPPEKTEGASRKSGAGVKRKREDEAASAAAAAAARQKLLAAAELAPRRRMGHLPGKQAALELHPTIPPPKYEFTRKNVWPPELARPRRAPRDDIPVCDCQPFRTGSARLSGSPGQKAPPAFLERSARIRAPAVQELGKRNCGPDCINRTSFVHCDPKTCPCGDACGNKPFCALPLPKMTAFHTGERGWGVRADEGIPEGALIVEYAGELISAAEKARRLQAQAAAGIHDFYMMELAPGVVIDARLRGNLARLINSSCDPNCETQKWRDAATDEVRIGIFSRREIAPFEELTYDYNFEHSGLAEAAGAYRCKCGAPNCRGTMDTRPDRLRDAFRRVSVFWEREGRWHTGTVLGFHAARGVHTIKYDDGQRAKENLRVVKHRWLTAEAPAVAAAVPLAPALQPAAGARDAEPADAHMADAPALPGGAREPDAAAAAGLEPSAERVAAEVMQALLDSVAGPASAGAAAAPAVVRQTAPWTAPQPARPAAVRPSPPAARAASCTPSRLIIRDWHPGGLAQPDTASWREPAALPEAKPAAPAEPKPAPSAAEPEPAAPAEPEPAPLAGPEPTASAEPELEARAQPDAEPAAPQAPQPAACEPAATAVPEPAAAAESKPAAPVEPEPAAAAEPEPAAPTEPEPAAAAEREPSAAVASEAAGDCGEGPAGAASSPLPAQAAVGGADGGAADESLPPAPGGTATEPREEAALRAGSAPAADAAAPPEAGLPAVKPQGAGTRSPGVVAVDVEAGAWDGRAQPAALQQPCGPAAGADAPVLQEVLPPPDKGEPGAMGLGSRDAIEIRQC